MLCYFKMNLPRFFQAISSLFLIKCLCPCKQFTRGTIYNDSARNNDFGSLPINHDFVNETALLSKCLCIVYAIFLLRLFYVVGKTVLQCNQTINACLYLQYVSNEE